MWGETDVMTLLPKTVFNGIQQSGEGIRLETLLYSRNLKGNILSAAACHILSPIYKFTYINSVYFKSVYVFRVGETHARGTSGAKRKKHTNDLL
jgi:hypothetical protein